MATSLPQYHPCFEPSICSAINRSESVPSSALLLLPINSEVYAVSEYAFWFGSLLIFLSALWRDDAIDQVPLRALFTVVGGLSSPMTVILAPIFIVRALRLRDRRETLICIIAVLWAVVQVALVYLTTPVPIPGAALAAISIPDVLAKFVGWYMFFPGIEGVAIGAWLGAAIIVVALFGIRRSPDFGLLVLGYILLAAVAASMARAPLQWVSAFTDGPRYFFYPYLLLSWLLIYGLASAERIEGILIALVLLLSLLQTYLYGQRRHETLDWAHEVARCAASERYVFPIHYDGVLDHAWHMELKGRECRRLVRRSLPRA
ncbi:hypothetical protein [Luteibacter mycovicinus]|uniref:hypothetical protein n=1 Tax=Luteibacter mycovicinus TaxID=1500890 RepID=UPI000563BC20|nr:hypothetical protein [Luteibacter sp. 9143a]